MDGFKGHTKKYEEIKDVFREHNVEVIFSPSYSSDQVQPLGLLGFNLLNLTTNISNIEFLADISGKTKEVVRIINALEAVSASILVTKA